MAVPKKKKSASATKRQRNAYILSQHVKIKKMVDRELRNEKGREKLGLDTSVSENPSEGKTVIAA